MTTGLALDTEPVVTPRSKGRRQGHRRHRDALRVQLSAEPSRAAELPVLDMGAPLEVFLGRYLGRARRAAEPTPCGDDQVTPTPTAGSTVHRVGSPPGLIAGDVDSRLWGYSAVARASVSQWLMCTWSKARPAVSSLPTRSATCPSSADRRRRTDCRSPNSSWSPEPGAPVGASADAASFLRRPGEEGDVLLDGRVPAPFAFFVLEAVCSELAVL